ncbi:MAG: hypothetical protein U0Q19_21975 [Kineosporiaceae bacterium]
MNLTRSLTRLRRATALVAVSLSTVGALGASVVAAAPSQAAAYINDCGPRITAASFSKFGDTNQYFEVPSAHMEFLQLSGWTTSGASLVAGNEPWYIASSLDSQSLRVASGGYVRTPTMCVAVGEDSLRFFYRSPGVAGSTLSVQMTATNGTSTASTSYTLDGSTAGWKVSNRLALPNVMGTTGTQNLTVTIRPSGTAAAWQVDDIQVDPWRTL